MQRPATGKSKARALAALAAAALFLAFLPHGRVGLDFRLESRGAHAALDLGLASFRIAFDSGRQCPKSNSCTGLLR
jgi:hypothetical protein